MAATTLIGLETVGCPQRPRLRKNCLTQTLDYHSPSSINHILKHEFFCLGRFSAQEKKVDLSFSEQLFRVVFSTFCGQNNEFKNFKNSVGSAIKSYTA